MRMIIEIPDTFSKDEVVLKKDLKKFIDDGIEYFTIELDSQTARRDESYKDKVYGAISTYKLLRNWLENYEIQM